MTILFVTHYSGFYGANKSLYTLMLLLQERYGVQSVVLLPCDGQMCAQLDKANIRYKISHYYWWVNYDKGFFQWLLNKRKQIINYCRVSQFCKLFKDERIDLIYTNSICVNIGVLLARRMRVPHIWQYREAFKQLDFKLSLSNRLSRKIWMDDVNKTYILISDYMMKSYRPYLPNDRMVRIYNGVDLPKGIEDRKTNHIKGRMKVVCSGILSAQKNQLEILKAQCLLRDRGVEVETYFLGSLKEDYCALMRQYISEHHLENLAHIVGHTNDVFGALREMNLGVVAARDEAFGRVTIEYMLMHMPVVVSDSGANLELIDEGKTGMIYPLGDVERLAESIEHYVNYPKLLQIQGDAAAKVAKEEFSAEKNAELIYEQIRKSIE